MRRLAERLSSLPAAERKLLGPIEPGREDVILGGALIVEGVLDRFRFSELVVNEADSLDGLLMWRVRAGREHIARHVTEAGAAYHLQGSGRSQIRYRREA